MGKRRTDGADIATRSAAAPVDGFCDPTFTAVREAFQENFHSCNELGAALCVFVDGRKVIDLWGGHQDRERTRPWQRDTLVNIYSVGKGVAAMLVLSQIEQGLLTLDQPLRGIWPELARAGKENITLRSVLSHRAGLPGIRRPLPPEALWRWETITAALAEQAPFWEPGSTHGYHVNTHGFLIGEPLVRRTGMSFGEILRTRLSARVGVDYHVGLAAHEHARVAPIDQDASTSVSDAGTAVREHLSSGDAATDAMLASVYFNPLGISGSGVVNLPRWRTAMIPSTNAHATARAVALLYDAFMHRDPARGGIVGPGLRAEACRIHSDGTDRVLAKHSRFGLGFQLSHPGRRIGGSDSSYGHAGYGTSIGFADPESGVAFAYLSNRPGKRFDNARAASVMAATYSALGRPP